VNAPPWLPTLLSLLLLALAGYSLWRLAVVRAFNRTTDYEFDVLNLLAGIAAAGLLSNWARTLPRAAWTVLFALGAAYFFVRVVRDRAVVEERRRLLGGFSCCAVLLYMFTAGVAPSTINGSTAGSYTMAGMPGMILDQTITYPTIGLIFVVGLAFSAVVGLNRIGSLPAPSPAPAVGGADDGTPLPLAPRSVQLCRILLLLILAYGILSKLV
jgi:hypothetical protein